MKNPLTELKTVLAKNSEDNEFLASFQGRIVAAEQRSNQLYAELQQNPSPELVDRFIAAQLEAEGLRIPVARAHEASVGTVLNRIAERSRPVVKAAIVAAVEKLRAELDQLNAEDLRRCETLGVNFAEFCKISNPVRGKMESNLSGLEASIARMDIITVAEIPLYGKLAIDILEAK